ncbi:MAG: hypothetical protein Q8N22_02090 [bacterium]|nr:hypothetical protein [bacterium]
MLQISRQQVLERWDTLPDNLREALFSEINANIVWQIGTLNHLSEEKISTMAMIVGDVIFGFLHPDDLAREIQEALNLNPQIVNPISHEINRKIFAPLRTDLEKVYSPASAMTEIKPTIKSEPETKVEKEIEFKPSGLRPEATTKPIEITDLPKAAQLPKTEIQPPKIEPVISPKPISAEQPFIIHQETETKAFTEKKKTTMPTMGWFKKESSKTPESPIKVELETFGQKIEEKKEPVVAKTEAPKQRIIHYREVDIPTPFGKTQGDPFGKQREQPQKEIAPQKIETPIIKPELPKPITPSAPPVINLDSFSVARENKNPNEVKLEGNTINLKNNKQLQ